VRALAVAYPLVTMLVVVATGNHFFLDVIAGALLACVTWLAVIRVGAWLSVRIATGRSHREPGRWRPVAARPASVGARPASVGAPDGGPAPRTARPGGEPGGRAEGDQVAA
jgi:PAP2 superfamily